MILAIDIGNSNVVIGGFENDRIEFTARVATDARRTEEQYAVEIHQILHLYGYSAGEMEGSIISSNLPPLTSVMKTALATVRQCRCGLAGAEDRAQHQAGQSRLVGAGAAVAAIRLYSAAAAGGGHGHRHHHVGHQ